MKLNPIFSSNMVFAAGKGILIYGTGKGKAYIDFAGHTKTVVSDGEEWYAEFPAMQYGGPYELTCSFEDEEIQLVNIYVGEVFLFAGQSNVEFKMWESSAPQSLYQPNDQLRLFSADKIDVGDRFKAKDGWVPCRLDNIKDWSALGYLAGSELARDRNIAVGIIACYQGSSSIESWLPKGTYARIGINLKDEEKHPGYFYNEPLSWHYASSLYSFALAQVFPFPVSAVVWYQGEGNTSPKEGKVYIKALTEFIKICRDDFRCPDLPFVIVQISDYSARNDEGWRAVQKAQEDVQDMLPFVKTVISADVCEDDNIHPKTKHHLANRISQALETFLDAT